MSHSKPKTEKNTVKHKTKEKFDGKEPKTTVTVSEKTLSTFINAVVDCNEEAILNIESDKLRVSLVDNGNIYMVMVDCECKTDIGKDAPVRVGVDFKLLKKTLMYAAGGNVTLEISKNQIGITYGRFTSKIPTADIAFMRKEPHPPELKLSTSFEMPGKYLLAACRMVSTGNGKIYIYVKSKVVFVAAHEGDLCMKEVVGTVGKSSQARSLFSNNYLLLIAKSIKDVSATCEIDIDHPIKITAEKNGCNLVFMLAPRIESD
jgi:DNA polymerase III sliding clamp (beta) subunit (PCNA family)